MAVTTPPLTMRRSLLGATIESTPGTAATVSTALANSVIYDAKLVPDGLFDDGERRAMSNYAGRGVRVKGLQKGKLTFRLELRHGDALFTLLRAAGYVFSGSAQLIMLPSSDLGDRDTLTFKLWEAGRVKSISGAQATSVKIAPAGAGQRVYAEFEFMGVWIAPEDDDMPSDPSVTTAAFRAAGMTLTEDSAAMPPVSTWEINLNPDTQPRLDVTAAAGLAMYLVEDRNPMITLDPEARLVDDYDAFGKLLAGDEEALQLVLTDGTNTLTIDAPKAQRLTVSDEARDNKRIDQIELECHNSSGDDDLKFTKSS